MARLSLASTDLSPNLTFFKSIRNNSRPKFTEFRISELTAVYLQLPKSIYFLCGAYEKLSSLSIPVNY